MKAGMLKIKFLFIFKSSSGKGSVHVRMANKITPHAQSSKEKEDSDSRFVSVLFVEERFWIDGEVENVTLISRS